MDLWEFKLWKAVAIVVVVGLACFLYTLFTGKDLREHFKDRSGDQS